jgi:hypothetical protein
MKIFSSLIILAFLFVNSKGQMTPIENNTINLEILKVDSLKKGIYKSLKDFQSNNPSILTDFKFGDKKGPLKYMPNTQLKKLFIYIDSNNQYIRYQEKHWGISDGKNAYILVHGKYLKVSLKGKYSIFIDITRSFSDVVSFNSFKIVDKEYLLNTTNGEKILLNKRNLGKLLQIEDTSLYNEFIKDKYKKFTLNIYVDRLNKLYKNE